MKPIIDICVLTAGRFDLLAKCLTNIQNEIEFTPCNVYVFDNGSPVEERTKNNELFNKPWITKHKRVNKNTGFPVGANSAIAMGSAPLVLFISDDILLQPGAVASLLQTMQQKEIGLCGLKLIFPADSTDRARPAGKVQHVGHSMDLRGNITHPFVGWSANNPRCCRSQEVCSVTGAVFMVRRKLFDAAGKFNPVYGKGYFEDVELGLNIRALGSKIWVDTNAVAVHYVGATFTQMKENIPMEQNKQIFLARNSSRLQWTDWTMR